MRTRALHPAAQLGWGPPLGVCKWGGHQSSCAYSWGQGARAQEGRQGQPSRPRGSWGRAARGPKTHGMWLASFPSAMAKFAGPRLPLVMAALVGTQGSTYEIQRVTSTGFLAEVGVTCSRWPRGLRAGDALPHPWERAPLCAHEETALAVGSVLGPLWGRGPLPGPKASLSPQPFCGCDRAKDGP